MVTMEALRYRIEDRLALIRTKYLHNVIFVHINKTGGSSVEAALGLPFQHRTALELHRELGERRWSSRFSFAFVRNPWSKVASHYAYRVQTNQTGLASRTPGFTEWVRLAYGQQDPRFYDQPKMFQPQIDWISDAHGATMVDFVGRFEQLEQDFATICVRIGRAAQLPHLKRGPATDYRLLYDTEAAEVVDRWFRRDIERFGYSFDDPGRP
jgi:chondroitin 4-sulfotransferase 11